MAGIELGKAFVQIVPSARGLEGATAKLLNGGMNNAGMLAGRSWGKAFVGILGTLGLGAAIGSIVSTGKEFDSAMSQVAATMGMTNDEFNQMTATVDGAQVTLRDFAQTMGATTAFSAKQAAEGLNYMALAGYSVQEAADMLPTVLNLAAAGSMDLAAASDMVTDAQSALGLSFNETTTMVDQMAKTASLTNTSVSQLGDAMLRIGATAQNLKGGTAELSAALGVLANSGIKGAEGGVHLRNMLLSLMNPGNEAAQMLQDLTGGVWDDEGNLNSLSEVFSGLNEKLSEMTQEDRTKIISNLFNRTDMASAQAMLAATTDSLEVYKASLATLGQESSNAALSNLAMGESLDEIAAAMMNGATAEETASRLMREFNLTQEDAQMVSKQLADVLDGESNQFETLTKSIIDSEGAAKKMSETLLDNLGGDWTIFQSALEGVKIALADGLTPALRGFVQLGGGIMQNFADNIKADGLSSALASLVQQLGTQFVPELIGTLASGVPALASGIVQMITTVVPQLLNSGAEMLYALADGISQGGSGFSEQGLSLMQEFLNNIRLAIPNLLSAGLDVISAIVDGIATGAPAFLGQALPMILKFVEGMRASAGHLVSRGMDIIINLVQGLMNALPTLIAWVPQIITNIAGIINDNAPKLLATGVKIIVTIVKGLINAVPAIISNIGNIAKMLIAVWESVNWLNLGKTVIEKIEEGIKTIGANVPVILQNIGNKAGELFHSIKWSDLGKKAINLLIKGITFLKENIPNLIKNIASKAWELFKSIDWIGLGKAVISKIISGITFLITKIPDTLLKIGKDALDKVKNIDWIQLGKDMINGIISGVASLGSSLWNKIKGIATGAKDEASSVDFSPIGEEWMNGLMSGIDKKMSPLERKAQLASQKAYKAMKVHGQISSPSKLFANIGKWWMAGVAVGIDKNLGLVTSALGDATDSAYNSVSSFAGDYSPNVNGASGVGGKTTVININTTVDGADNPEDFASRLVRQLQLDMRAI